MQKADDHIGDLHAGVVDVVLHIDLCPAARSRRTKVSPRMALRRWPMCAALLGLMLVCSTSDVDALLRTRGCCLPAGQRRAARRRRDRGGIDVAGAGDFESGEAVERAERGDDLLRDDLWALCAACAPVQRRWAWRFRRSAGRAASPAGSFSISRSYFSLSTARRRSPSRFCSSRTRDEPQKILDFQGDSSTCGDGGRSSRQARQRREARGRIELRRCNTVRWRVDCRSRCSARVRERNALIHDRIQLRIQNRFYLTTPIYYVNARPHLGHAYSTIVCDAIARRKRALGIETWFLTGTDEHGQKIERSAKLAGCTPQEFATKIAGEFRGLWDRLGLTYDDFIRTTEDAAHARRAEAVCDAARQADTSTRARTRASIASPTRRMWTGRRARLAPIAGG